MNLRWATLIAVLALAPAAAQSQAAGAIDSGAIGLTVGVPAEARGADGGPAAAVLASGFPGDAGNDPGAPPLADAGGAARLAAADAGGGLGVPTVTNAGGGSLALGDAGSSPAVLMLTDAGLGALDAGIADAGARDAGTAVRDAGPPPPPWNRAFALLSAIMPPFKKAGVDAETRILFDGPTSGAEKASLVLVTANGNIEVWPHRHPSGAELVYVLEGAAKVRGTGKKWTDLRQGDAVYLAPGVAHGWWWNGSKTRPARLLFLYSPPGPERAFREQGGADVATVPVAAAEVRRPDPRAPQPLVMTSAAASSYIIARSKGLVRIYFDGENTPDSRAYLGVLRADPGMVVPEHTHELESELLYVTSGRGELSLDGRTVPVIAGMAIHFPPRHRHSLKVFESLEAVQFYAPAGPEQRFKAK